MSFTTIIFVFLASFLWGSYVGAKFSNKYPSETIILSKGSAIIGNLVFTFIAVSLLLTAPAGSGIGAMITLGAIPVGLIAGFFVGKSTYTII